MYVTVKLICWIMEYPRKDLWVKLIHRIMKYPRMNQWGRCLGIRAKYVLLPQCTAPQCYFKICLHLGLYKCTEMWFCLPVNVDVKYILMALCKTAVTPVHQQWSYCSLALSYRHEEHTHWCGRDRWLQFCGGLYPPKTFCSAETMVQSILLGPI